MTYELAKELKDAGFPFLGNQLELGDEVAILPTQLKGKLLSIEHGIAKIRVEGVGMQHVPIEVVRSWKVPTLEELIEACGTLNDRILLDGNTKDGWEVYAGDIETPNVKYPTPTEAVARLWLALNPPHGERANLANLDSQ